jgi:multimeric flavodoxin WrbA
MTDEKSVLAISSSPRRNGNSKRLLESAVDGAKQAGHHVEFIYLADWMTGFLRDCKECRSVTGECTILDRYDELFKEKFLPADAVIYATPLWWYGMSGQLKSFFDRMFCYVAFSYPHSESVANQIMGKRVAMVMSAEESNFGARLAVVKHMHELCRYLHHSFVGFVTGIGNRRGDVTVDPLEPEQEAFKLGQRIFHIEPTDYQLDTERSSSVWENGIDRLPGYWR